MSVKTGSCDPFGWTIAHRAHHRLIETNARIADLQKRLEWVRNEKQRVYREMQGAEAERDQALDLLREARGCVAGSPDLRTTTLLDRIDNLLNRKDSALSGEDKGDLQQGKTPGGLADVQAPASGDIPPQALPDAPSPESAEEPWDTITRIRAEREGS